MLSHFKCICEGLLDYESKIAKYICRECAKIRDIPIELNNRVAMYGAHNPWVLWEMEYRGLAFNT